MMNNNNFDIAYKFTMGHEIGYVNDKIDKGGETFDGISRKYHPNWAGWVIIDKGITKNDILLLEKLKREFYYKEYFVPIRGDYLPIELSKELFDNAVNCGVDTSIKFLQRALNFLNRDKKLFLDLTVDGKFGNITLSAINNIIDSGETKLLLKVINVLQGNHYIEITENDSTQKKFSRGWFGRVFI